MPLTPSSANRSSPVSRETSRPFTESAIVPAQRSPFSPATSDGRAHSRVSAGRQGVNECPSGASSDRNAFDPPSFGAAMPPAATITRAAESERPSAAHTRHPLLPPSSLETSNSQISSTPASPAVSRRQSKTAEA